MNSEKRRLPTRDHTNVKCIQRSQYKVIVGTTATPDKQINPPYRWWRLDTAKMQLAWWKKDKSF